MKGSSKIFHIFIPIILIMGTLTCFSFTYFSFGPNEVGQNLAERNSDRLIGLQLVHPRNANSNREIRAAQKEVPPGTKKQGTMKYFMKNAKLLDLDIPQTIIDAQPKEIQIKKNRVNIMNIDTFYRDALPAAGTTVTNQTVLLLHGASFKSQTWVDLNTISILSKMGHRVVAVDLPGFGETGGSFSGSKGEYLNELIVKLQLNNFIIVSPSMSGGYSIPYFIHFSKDLDGFVPVAPVSTRPVVSEASKIDTPTLVLYGERDKSLGYSSRDDLSNLPNSQVVVLPGARHPAYLDQPEMFHTLLYNFLKQIKDHKSS